MTVVKTDLTDIVCARVIEHASQRYQQTDDVHVRRALLDVAEFALGQMRAGALSRSSEHLIRSMRAVLTRGRQ